VIVWILVLTLAGSSSFTSPPRGYRTEVACNDVAAKTNVMLKANKIVDVTAACIAVTVQDFAATDRDTKPEAGMTRPAADL
jgi:hypothetical protein